MAAIRFKNPTEYAFLIWLDNFPESFHPLDMDRFYCFVRSVKRYNSSKWLEYEYFKKKILSHSPKFDEENVELFHSKLIELIDFSKVPPMPLVDILFNKERKGYFQRGVIGGKIYEVEIGRDEVFGRGATEETMKKAKFLDKK